jgi:membrane protein DedA with SNARE-associated domain
MTLAQFITSYGYFAVFFGVLLEGETILIAAGLAAHRGYVSLPAVIGVAFAATLAVDQALFTFGRRRGAAYVTKHVSLRPKVERVNTLFGRHYAWFIVIRRFLYGLRTVSSVVLGMSDVPAGRFLVFNAIGAAIWAATMAGLGYLFGAAVVSVLGRIEHVEREIMIGILGAGALLWLVRAAWAGTRRRRVRRRLEAEGPVDVTDPDA